MPLITINQMQKYYGDNHVLKGVDLDIDMGEVISIIGRSGSGKSTLLRCINGLEGYQEGSIKLGGMTITDRDSQAREISRSIGMVFQNFNLFPHMTALENVMLAPRRVLKKSQAECRELAQRMLEKVGLGDRLDYYPANLSGGQQQRVAIARTLVLKPRIILMDEPFSALDEPTRIDMQAMITQLWKEVEATVFIVTHSLAEAVYLGDRIFMFTPNPGRLAGISYLKPDDIGKEPGKSPLVVQEGHLFKERLAHITSVFLNLQEGKH